MALPKLVSISDVQTHRTDPDLIALEIVRRHALLLRRFNGISVFSFIAKTFGQRCRCFDFVKQRVTSSRCLDCFNTGFTGGYFSGIPGYMAFEITSEMKQAAVAWGELEDDQTTAWTVNYPLLSPRDMIVESDSRRRWRVEAIQEIHQKGYVIMQILRLARIDKGDIESEVELGDFDLTSAEDAVVRFFGGSSGDYTRILEDESRGLAENTWQWDK